MKLDSTDIQGNAGISRNINAGGNAEVKGDVTVGHNLTVRGWVDAPHIKGPLKGLYASEEALKAAYPRPRAGWYALVGDTIPADVWRAECEKGIWHWVPTGEQGGETALWLDNIEGDIKELRDDVQGLKDMTDEGMIMGDSVEVTSTPTAATLHYRVKKQDGTEEPKEVALPTVDNTHSGMMTPADKQKADEAASTANTALTTARAAQETAQASTRAVMTLAGKVGESGGIAPLGPDCKIPAVYLPECSCGGGGGDVIIAEPMSIPDSEIDAMFREVLIGDITKPGPGDIELNPIG